MYRYMLLIHVVSATVWTGGHLFLALRILPAALKERSAATLLGFEKRYEALGMSALAIQLVTGLDLAAHLLPFRFWFSLGNPTSQMLALKWTCLAVTIAFALDAQLRVLPKLRDDNIRSMVPHIVTVTTASVLFIVAGVGIRTGGWF